MSPSVSENGNGGVADVAYAVVQMAEKNRQEVAKRQQALEALPTDEICDLLTALQQRARGLFETLFDANQQIEQLQEILAARAQSQRAMTVDAAPVPTRPAEPIVEQPIQGNGKKDEKPVSSEQPKSPASTVVVPSPALRATTSLIRPLASMQGRAERDRRENDVRVAAEEVINQFLFNHTRQLDAHIFRGRTKFSYVNREMLLRLPEQIQRLYGRLYMLLEEIPGAQDYFCSRYNFHSDLLMAWAQADRGLHPTNRRAAVMGAVVPLAPSAVPLQVPAVEAPSSPMMPASPVAADQKVPEKESAGVGAVIAAQRAQIAEQLLAAITIPTPGTGGRRQFPKPLRQQIVAAYEQWQKEGLKAKDFIERLGITYVHIHTWRKGGRAQEGEA